MHISSKWYYGSDDLLDSFDVDMLFDFEICIDIEFSCKYNYNNILITVFVYQQQKVYGKILQMSLPTHGNFDHARLHVVILLKTK